MSEILKDKNALITGAGSGIGRAAAKIFAQQGASVLMVDLKVDESALKEVQDAAKAVKSPAIVEMIAGDVSVEANVKDAVAKAKALGGRNKLHIMFNNAGVQRDEDGEITTESTLSAAYEKTLNVNVKGVLHGCKHAIMEMKSTGGSIINSSNFGAIVGSAEPHVIFAASKGAVLSLTRELAVAHAKDNIRVNSLLPGPVATPQSFDSPAIAGNATVKDAWLARMPFGHAAKPEEVANVALFLASDLSSYVTGAELVVDGGLSAAFLAHKPGTKPTGVKQ